MKESKDIKPLLVKKFFTLFSLFIATFILLISASSYSKPRETQIRQLTTLTKLPGIALSTPYLENRVLYYRDHSSRLYPKMKNYSKMDYVYAR